MTEHMSGTPVARRSFWHQLAGPTAVVVVVCLIYVAGVLVSAAGDPLAFVVLGTRFSQGDPHGSEGYDGQFAYQIAQRPLAAAPFLDVPAYRYQRILYPVLAHLLALGHPDAVPWALIVLNVAAIALGSWAAGRLLASWGVSRWYALAYGLYGGQLLALRTDLNEPLAQALVLCAILAWARERKNLAVICFGLAALTKETMLVFLAAYLLWCLGRCRWRDAFGLCMGAAPFVAFQLILWGWLGTLGVSSGGANATPFSPVPLGGWLGIVCTRPTAFLLVSLIVVPMSVLPALTGIGLSLRDLVRGMDHPIVVSLFLNCLVILFLPASTFREPAAMVRLTQAVMAAMLLYGGLRRSGRILTYSMLWLANNVLLIKGVAP